MQTETVSSRRQSTARSDTLIALGDPGAIHMFVRFRQRNGRLLVSPAKSRHCDGGVRQDNVQVERSLRQWRVHFESCEEQVKLHLQLKALIEGTIDQWTKEAARARANVEAAQAALLDPAKPVPAPLTRSEAIRILRKLGMTKQQIYRARKLAQLSDEEFEQRHGSKRRG